MDDVSFVLFSFVPGFSILSSENILLKYWIRISMGQKWGAQLGAQFNASDIDGNAIGGSHASAL